MRGAWKLLGGATVAALGLVLLLSSTVSGQAQGDGDGSDELPSMPTSEPATEPMGNGPRWEANAPYASGPGATDYDHLPPADKAIADKINTEAEERGAVLSIYAASAQQDFEKGITKLAQLRLGLEQLDEIGVVGGARDGADGTPGLGASGLDGMGAGQ